MRIPRFPVQKILNHAEPGVTAINDRYEYDKEKREALEAWNKRLMMMVSMLSKVKTEAQALKGTSIPQRALSTYGPGDRFGARPSRKGV